MSKGDRIREMLEEGKKYKEIMTEVGVASSTIAYHAKVIGKQKFTFERKAHDWDAIQACYDIGYTFQDISDEFRVDASTLFNARKIGKMVTEDTPARKIAVQRRRIAKQTDGQQVARRSWDMNQLCEKSLMNRKSLKRIVRIYDLIPEFCGIQVCPLNKITNPTWAGQDIVLHIDHINGVRDDNRVENIRWICPNCHSQTSTYCGRNNRLTESSKPDN